MLPTYSILEYNQRLGCYIKWLSGNPHEHIDTLCVMSAFHLCINGYEKYDRYNKYAEYLLVSVTSILEHTDYHVRIYVDDTLFSKQNTDAFLWQQQLALLQAYDRVQILCIKMPRYYNTLTDSHMGLLATMFRYLALFDANVDVCLFRDIDNVWTQQHTYFVNKWLTEGDEEICVFMNSKYRRQQMCGLTPNGVILSDKMYTSVFSGLFSINKRSCALPTSIWYKAFAFIESYTDLVFEPQYATYRHYGDRFIYGFDEVVLSRVVLPTLLGMGMRIYAIPVRVYDPEYFTHVFEHPLAKHVYSNLVNQETHAILKHIILRNYWHMNSINAGLSQYIIALYTNVLHKLIVDEVYSTDITTILKEHVYPAPILMGMGVFTFHNYKRYAWYGEGDGASIVDRYINTTTQLTLSEMTADSDLCNEGDGDECGADDGDHPCPEY